MFGKSCEMVSRLIEVDIFMKTYGIFMLVTIQKNPEQKYGNWNSNGAKIRHAWPPPLHTPFWILVHIPQINLNEVGMGNPYTEIGLPNPTLFPNLFEGVRISI